METKMEMHIIEAPRYIIFGMAIAVSKRPRYRKFSAALANFAVASDGAMLKPTREIIYEKIRIKISHETFLAIYESLRDLCEASTEPTLQKAYDCCHQIQEQL